MPAERVAFFYPLLQKGFVFRTRPGIPVGALLRDGLGLSAEYIEARIQTVFLDGKPVDDLERALLGEGSTLALAPAMPGLMGAMFRRGGYYAPMRGAITHRGGALPQGAGEGRITVKLFGMALRELGPRFLARGIEVGGEDLAALLESLPEDCREGPGSDTDLRARKTVLLQVGVIQEKGEGGGP